LAVADEKEGLRKRADDVRAVIKAMDQQIAESQDPQEIELVTIRRTALQLELDALNESLGT
jgi:hypothetical protein